MSNSGERQKCRIPETLSRRCCALTRPVQATAEIFTVVRFDSKASRIKKRSLIMWPDKLISLDEYADLCAQTDVNVAYSPAFVEYSFARLGVAPKIVAKRDKHGSVIAAFPSVRRTVFPSLAHKRLLHKDEFARLGDIGQPEALFPVLPNAGRFWLTHFSPLTSSLLSDRVRTFGSKCIRHMAIAKERRHKKLTARAKQFLESGGKVRFSEDMSPGEFSYIYGRLYETRWNAPIAAYNECMGKIGNLYDHVHGLVLTDHADNPVAAQLCYKHTSPTTHHVDFINSGVLKVENDNNVSYGSIMMLTSLRRAEEKAKELGKKLRYSFGFNVERYKEIWTDPEPTFIAI